MTDYEREYQRNEAVCGEPFPELVAFFNSLPGARLSVLDLGCGQGRDALMAAALGHVVHGVDSAPTGIAQIRQQALSLGLTVDGEVADLHDYQSDRSYDVVVLDRVVHMMGAAEHKKRLLNTAASAASPGGCVLIVDTPSNLTLVEEVFSTSEWETMLRKKGFRFYRRCPSAA